MEYECHLKPATSLYTDFNKIIKPLCSSCTNHSCENPIVEQKVSVIGEIYTARLYNVGSHYYQVVSCDGYNGYKGEDEEDEEII